MTKERIGADGKRYMNGAEMLSETDKPCEYSEDRIIDGKLCQCACNLHSHDHCSYEGLGEESPREAFGDDEYFSSIKDVPLVLPCTSYGDFKKAEKERGLPPRVWNKENKQWEEPAKGS